MWVNMQAPHFGVPERIMHSRSDLYQIGLVIVALCRLTYQPLTIVRPAQGGRPRELVGEQYSRTLNRLVERCLRTRPEDRISVRELREALRREKDNGRSSSRDPHGMLLFPTMWIYER